MPKSIISRFEVKILTSKLYFSFPRIWSSEWPPPAHGEGEGAATAISTPNGLAPCKREPDFGLSWFAGHFGTTPGRGSSLRWPKRLLAGPGRVGRPLQINFCRASRVWEDFFRFSDPQNIPRGPPNTRKTAALIGAQRPE